MLRDGKIWVANNDAGEVINLLPRMANRHGLIAGATGTGKTVTARVLSEAFSDMGVPVFLADVKGDLAGIMTQGTDSADMQERIQRFGLDQYGFQYQGYPVTLWDIYGKNGIPLRTTITEMGPLLMSRILQLNSLQTDVLSIMYRIADDQNLLLTDIKDLKAMLYYVQDHSKEFVEQYCHIRSDSIDAIMRALISLEGEDGDVFFGETALNIADWMQMSNDKGMINILDSQRLINNDKLYTTFLLWLLSELSELMPEVGDLDRPKMVFFFDEAHLLFKDANNLFLGKVEKVVKLLRSKGVGVYFCTQNSKDIPNNILKLLGNRIQHAPRAYTTVDKKAVRAAAQTLRDNPAFDTYATLLALEPDEALISFLGEDGIPAIVQKAYVLPPQSRMGAITDSERDQSIKSSFLYTKYSRPYDPDSAYEFLQRLGLEEAAAAEQARADALAAKEQAKADAAKAREEAREAQRTEAAKKRAKKTAGSTVAGTVDREAGKGLGDTSGKNHSETSDSNRGAKSRRGFWSTLFKK